MSTATQEPVFVYVTPVRQIQEVIDRLAGAARDLIRLTPLTAMSLEVCRDIAQRKTPLGTAATDLIHARDALHAELHRELRRAQSDMELIVYPFLTEKLGSAVPGVVVLPTEGQARSIRETVLGLESVHERDGEIVGVLRVAPAAPGGVETRGFYTRDGRTFFDE